MGSSSESLEYFFKKRIISFFNSRELLFFDASKDLNIVSNILKYIVNVLSLFCLQYYSASADIFLLMYFLKAS